MEQEGIIRLSIFFGLFFVFAATEYIYSHAGWSPKVKLADGLPTGR